MANIYPTLMSEALPDKKRVNEAKAKLEKAGVKYILSCWIDLLGIPKTKPIPISEFELLCAGKGPQFAVHSVSFVPELGPNDSDQIPVPDLDSLMICPWDKTCAWVFSDLWWEDKPYNLCPRQTLKRAVKNAEDAGYRAFCGIEPEFIAMRWENGQPVKAIDDDPLPGEGVRPRRQAFGYDVEYSIDSMEFLGEMIDTLNELGWGLKDVVCEGAYSQFELDFTYTNVLQMADRLVFLRVLLKEIAKNHGMFITFMPKPTIGDWRSGAHINFSLTSTANSKNIFEGKNGKFSDTAYHSVGGLIKHGSEITALACSTVNSYNGLVPVVGGFEGGVHTWAPTQMAYGDNNRSCMLRLPQNRFCIENRAADMCMNPYLSLALTTAAAIDGIKNKIDPGKPLNVNLYTLSPEEIKASKIKSLPRNLLEAIEKLQHDDFAKEVLGESMLNQFFAYKMDEWDRYHQAVTDWEVTEYLRLY
ncbi:glutamine synthetase family protein [Candidatus Thioglobus sp.]|nr:glutamine synthetase family protein [Candidatus Thioglobus sp.]